MYRGTTRIAGIALVAALAATGCGSGGAEDGQGGSRSFDTTQLEGAFPIGVWLQDPMHTANGRNTAEQYRELGITHWMGIQHWPSEANRYPGYNLQAAAVLQALGFVVYAGADQDAVAWNTAHPEYADTFRGYLVGDEPDMTKQFVADHHPDTWLQNSAALRSADPTREIWANFGKGFAKNPWVGYQPFPGPTIQDDHNKYTRHLDLVSVDIYGLTDPWEMPNYVGVWTYGKAVDNTRGYVDANPDNPGLPVWGFVETGSPTSSSAGLYPTIPAELIRPTVWNVIVHGADGFIYFNHDFLVPGTTATYPLDRPEVGAAVLETNRSVRAYGAVLTTPSLAGTSVVVDGDVPVTVLTKRFRGDTFLFAMADGSEAFQASQACSATISLAVPDGVVEVLEEARTLPLSGGGFVDQFDPYELHIYRIPGAN